MPKVLGRLRAIASALIAGLLLVGLIGPATTQALDPPNIERFMEALGAVESNGRYDAVNATSGALGKYQILPSNWQAWSGKYPGDPNAAPTPGNQDTVARAKLTALYDWLGDWGSVAHWWLTGDGDTNPNHWSDRSRGYVDKILAYIGAPVLSPRRAAPPSSSSTATVSGAAGLAPASRVYDESDRAIDFSGGWGQAEFASYNGGIVRYAVSAGATAWFTFSVTVWLWLTVVFANLAEALLRLEIDGVELIDTSPRRRAEGPVAFLHPRSCHGVLVELIEAPGGPSWRALGYQPG